MASNTTAPAPLACLGAAGFRIEAALAERAFTYYGYTVAIHETTRATPADAVRYIAPGIAGARRGFKRQPLVFTTRDVSLKGTGAALLAKPDADVAQALAAVPMRYGDILLIDGQAVYAGGDYYRTIKPAAMAAMLRQAFSARPFHEALLIIESVDTREFLEVLYANG